MDRVRFGRALGYGARHAAKSLAAAVDAATTPNPSAAARPAPGAGSSPEAAAPQAPAAPQTQAAQTAQRPAQPFAAPLAATRGTNPRAANSQRVGQVLKAGKQASRSVLGPVKKATSVVMLQVTGSFFGLLAFGMGRGLWALRAGFHAPLFSQAFVTVWIMAAIVVGLAYFCVSNFVRAGRRDRS